MFRIRLVSEMVNNSSDVGYAEIQNKSSFSGREQDWFSKSEWKKIDSKIRSLNPISDGSGDLDHRILYNVKGNYMVYNWNCIGEIYRIEKYEDEWYYVEVSHYNIRPVGKVWRYPSYHIKRYECDQFSGLLKMIEDTIGVAIPIPDKDS